MKQLDTAYEAMLRNRSIVEANLNSTLSLKKVEKLIIGVFDLFQGQINGKLIKRINLSFYNDKLKIVLENETGKFPGLRTECTRKLYIQLVQLQKNTLNQEEIKWFKKEIKKYCIIDEKDEASMILTLK